MVQAPPNRDIELHRELVERILQTNQFNRSARLSLLFQYLCNRVLEDGAEEIHELEVGHKVFGRPARYDTTADNIVRVHASLLRKRLADYFRTDGRSEEFVIEIPRGNYAPIIRRRRSAETATPSTSPVSRPFDPFEAFAERPALETPALVAPEPGPTPVTNWRRWIFPVAAAALAVVSVVLFLKLQELKARTTAPAILNGPAVTNFWRGVFPAQGSIDVVIDDASLSFYEEATGQSVPIGQYFDRSYIRAVLTGPGPPEHDPNWLHQLLIRRQSSYSESAMVWKLAQIAASQHSDARLQFARDLSFRQTKSDNLVLLGTPASDPWIQLFQGNLTLHWSYDPIDHVYFPVDTTAPAGHNQLKTLNESNTRQAYATISWLPNLAGNGSALIISGTGGAATDAAMDWLLQDSSLEQLRSRLPRGSSSRFPYFESLLRIEKGIDRPRSITIAVCRPIKGSTPQAQH